jgi:hypothetical protein
MGDVEVRSQIGVRQYGGVLNHGAAINLTVVLDIRATCEEYTRPQRGVGPDVARTDDADPRMQTGARSDPDSRAQFAAIGPDCAPLEQRILGKAPEFQKRAQAVCVLTVQILRRG